MDSSDPGWKTHKADIYCARHHAYRLRLYSGGIVRWIINNVRLERKKKNSDKSVFSGEYLDDESYEIFFEIGYDIWYARSVCEELNKYKNVLEAYRLAADAPARLENHLTLPGHAGWHDSYYDAFLSVGDYWMNHLVYQKISLPQNRYELFYGDVGVKPYDSVVSNNEGSGLPFTRFTLHHDCIAIVNAVLNDIPSLIAHEYEYSAHDDISLIKEAQRYTGEVPPNDFPFSGEQLYEAKRPRISDNTEKAISLLIQGISRQTVADRLGMSVNNVSQIKRRYTEKGDTP